MMRFQYKRCFPNFDYELPEIKGFVDDSWRHDSCPSLLMHVKNGHIKLFCDYANKNRRAFSNDRFIASYNSNDDMNVDIFYHSEDLFVIREAIETYLDNNDLAPDLEIVKTINHNDKPVLAYIINHEAIFNPYFSSCGRFDAVPWDDYGITEQQAQRLAQANKIFGYDDSL